MCAVLTWDPYRRGIHRCSPATVPPLQLCHSTIVAALPQCHRCAVACLPHLPAAKRHEQARSVGACGCHGRGDLVWLPGTAWPARSSCPPIAAPAVLSRLLLLLLLLLRTLPRPPVPPLLAQPCRSPPGTQPTLPTPAPPLLQTPAAGMQGWRLMRGNATVNICHIGGGERRGGRGRGARGRR